MWSNTTCTKPIQTVIMYVYIINSVISACLLKQKAIDFSWPKHPFMNLTISDLLNIVFSDDTSQCPEKLEDIPLNIKQGPILCFKQQLKLF